MGALVETRPVRQELPPSLVLATRPSGPATQPRSESAKSTAVGRRRPTSVRQRFVARLPATTPYCDTATTSSELLVRLEISSPGPALGRQVRQPSSVRPAVPWPS